MADKGNRVYNTENDWVYMRLGKGLKDALWRVSKLRLPFDFQRAGTDYDYAGHIGTLPLRFLTDQRLDAGSGDRERDVASRARQAALKVWGSYVGEFAAAAWMAYRADGRPGAAAYVHEATGALDAYRNDLLRHGGPDTPISDWSDAVRTAFALGHNRGVRLSPVPGIEFDVLVGGADPGHDLMVTRAPDGRAWPIDVKMSPSVRHEPHASGWYPVGNDSPKALSGLSLLIDVRQAGRCNPPTDTVNTTSYLQSFLVRTKGMQNAQMDRIIDLRLPGDPVEQEETVAVLAGWRIGLPPRVNNNLKNPAHQDPLTRLRTMEQMARVLGLAQARERASAQPAQPAAPKAGFGSHTPAFVAVR